MESVFTATIVLSGALCAGKTTLAQGLEEQIGAHVLSARTVLIQLTAARGRAQLQDAGKKIEMRTEGRWLAATAIELETPDCSLVIDAARTAAQLEALRSTFAGVTHIHLCAASGERERRYRVRRDAVDMQVSFQQASADDLERVVDNLRLHSDIAIETTNAAPEVVLDAVLAFLNRPQRAPGPRLGGRSA
jgi:adenylosuccinate synthase